MFEAVRVQVQVVYQQLLPNWQLSVGIVGVPDKSQYLPLVATVQRLQVCAYQLNAELVIYPQLLASWQLSVGIVGVLVKLQ